jgi:hypothetical protein
MDNILQIKYDNYALSCDPRLLRIKDIQEFLQDVGASYCLGKSKRYLKRLRHFRDVVDFTWREDQEAVLNNFLDFDKKYYVVHAVFGSGKTTLLLGMLIFGLMRQLYQPSDVMFMSFNVCIKNEIKRKLKKYGIGSKIIVRTFDSVVYEICKHTGYNEQYLKMPNFEGKRKHALNLCFEGTDFRLKYQPKLLFIDECQDLERSTLEILRTFYPDTKFVFAGDIFQSIQKEPRESILWHFMKQYTGDDIYKIYMSETPRVPRNILHSLQNALSTYYPEFSEQIWSWESTNTVSDADIEWRRLHSYTHIFNEIEDFCSTHKAEETMILTFSSAITVKGNMGDVARLRNYLLGNGYDINKNHKKLDPDSYFLSTANSSKGLERDYVICFLTFPLEKAFVSLSDDIVVNLITVALTRAKKKVIMYVPSYEDKFSRVLHLFESCPQPDRQRIREDNKSLDDFKCQDYLDIEHSVTEIIKQSIIKYDTRLRIKEHIKLYNFQKIFEDRSDVMSVPRLITEEEKAFVGILIENLITSTWTGYWPQINDASNVANNPMYAHCIKRIMKLLDTYKQYISGHSVFNESEQFQGIYYFSQIHVALNDKIFMDLSPNTCTGLKFYWNNFKPKCYLMKPTEEKLVVQSRLRMPWLTGVADCITTGKITTSTNTELSENTVYEIKASIDPEWKDDALTQAMCYALMSGKTWSRIVLLNPFRNERNCYHFNSKSILSLRRQVTQDILIYNTNCMMAKLHPKMKTQQYLDITDNLFIDIQRENGEILQASVIYMLSPIRCELLYNSYTRLTYNIAEGKELTKTEKSRRESIKTQDELILDINTIINSEMYKGKRIWTTRENKGIQAESEIVEIYKYFDLKNYKSVFKRVQYEKNTELQYSMDLNDSLCRNIFNITYMFHQRKFE